MSTDTNQTEAVGSPVERPVRPLVERLRDAAQGVDLGADGMGWSPDPSLMREAADEIERLRADAARWRKFCKRMQHPGNPMRGKWRLVEISPMYGDEKDIDDVQRAVDAA